MGKCLRGQGEVFWGLRKRRNLGSHLNFAIYELWDLGQVS